MTANVDLSAPRVLAHNPNVTVSLSAPIGRLSLRVRQESVQALSAALECPLTPKIGTVARVGELEALCLGPDEWLLLAPEHELLKLVTACAKIYASTPHSLTEITDREVTIGLDGAEAITLLEMGCPRNIALLPVGEARRTVMDGATVVLWRDQEQTFRMDIWRSFAPHVIALLETGTRELAAG